MIEAPDWEIYGKNGSQLRSRVRCTVCGASNCTEGYLDEAVKFGLEAQAMVDRFSQRHAECQTVKILPLRTRDIPDRLICETVAEFQSDQSGRRAGMVDRIVRKTGCHYKVAWSALSRAEARGLIDYGVNIAYPWLTDKGKELLRDA